MTFTVSPLPGNIGRQISRLDIESEIAPEIAKALRALWLEHGLLVFPGIGTSPEAQLRLSRCFGELEPHPIPKFRHPDYAELILLTNQDGPSGPVYDFGDGTAIHGRIPWHTDLAFKTIPNAGALLRMARKTTSGGQTGWIDSAMAYDALPEATKHRIASLEAVYLFRAGLEEMRFARPPGTRLDQRKDEYPHFPPVANPLVTRHPETGRKVLNLSSLNIDGILGLPRAQGDALIEELLAHLEDPAFRYIHEWQENDMVLWDNRRMLHCALGHPLDQVRVVHRTTIKGGVALGREATAAEMESMA
jgi:taurine dioxygenase